MTSAIQSTIVFALLLVCSFAEAKDTHPKIEPQPLWADTTQVDYRNTDLDREADDGYVDLIFDKQTNLELQSVYTKKALRIISETGIQNASEISVDFDPSYQQLFFHSLLIIRKGQVINKLDLSKFRTVHQEKELHRFIYNGTVTTMMILEDVQKGDIIEYSYSIHGFNPVFGNKYSDTYTLAYGVPVYRLHYKLFVPATKSIDIKNNGSSLKPGIAIGNRGTAYNWNLFNTHALQEQDKLPSWYDIYPVVMVSEFKNWKEVNDWAISLFPVSSSLSPALQTLVDGWKKKYNTEEQRLTAALHFVQDDIRYMGIEMGKNSYKPHSPERVMQQRFGDCKDKSYLLCTLLHAMNIAASPVLISTSYKRMITNRLPSPSVFDHCTVRVQLAANTFWFDPTIMYQRGALQSISFPDYQEGLVVHPATTALTSIPHIEKGRVDVKESFLATNLNGPVPLVVTTTYSGSFADDIRYDFKSSSVHELQQSYRDFYANYFSKIDIDSLTYDDQEESGQFITREYYTIHDLWSTERGVSHLLFEPYIINSIIDRPKQKERTMPFSLNYPARYHEDIEVMLPDEKWHVGESDHHFETPDFRFDCRYSSKAGDVALLSYDYENRKDFVAPSEASEYFGQLDLADKTITYEFTNDGNKAIPVQTTFSADNRFQFLYLILIACVVITYVIKRRKSVY
jgi:hypothetical protein